MEDEPPMHSNQPYQNIEGSGINESNIRPRDITNIVPTLIPPSPSDTDNSMQIILNNREQQNLNDSRQSTFVERRQTLEVPNFQFDAGKPPIDPHFKKVDLRSDFLQR